MFNEQMAGEGLALGAPVIPWSAEWVRCADIQIASEYQRAEEPSIIARLAQKFNPDLAFPLRVSRRADGSLWIQDGQHRLQAARACGYDTVYCHIEDSSIPAEARAFVGLNSGTKAHSLRRFKAALIAGDDPVVADVARIIAESGFVIHYDGFGMEPFHFHAVQTALNLYRMRAPDRTAGPERLRRVLALARATWPGKSGSGQSTILRALDSLFMNERVAVLDQRRFIARAALLDPASVAITAHHRSRSLGHAADLWALKDMVDKYNSGLREASRRLADPLPAYDDFAAPAHGLTSDENEERNQ